MNLDENMFFTGQFSQGRNSRGDSRNGSNESTRAEETGRKNMLQNSEIKNHGRNS